MRTARRTPALLATAIVVALVALAACSSGGDDGSGGSVQDAAAPAEADAGAREDLADTNTFSVDRTGTKTGAVEQKVISKGNVSLFADDVADAAVDVQRLTDELGGEVAEHETTTDDDGEVRTTRMVLRIPSVDFDDAFTELEQVADLRSSSSTAEDVTTEVIDTRVRIRAQRRSLARVEVLLDRAESISDIVRIEAQLTRRTADLESLEQRLAFLEDQTSMATITVNVERAPEEKAEERPEEDETGFLAGLSSGWKALGTFGTGLATVAGAVLPFAVVVLLLGGPSWLLVRRARRRTPPGPATPADA